MNTPVLHQNHQSTFVVKRIEELEPHSVLFDDRPHKQSVFEIVWITDGKGIMEVDKIPYPLKENSLFILPPGYVRNLRTSEMIDGYYLSLSSDFLCRIKPYSETTLFDPLSLIQKGPYCAELEAEMTIQLDSIIRLIANELGREQGVRRDLLYAYTGAFLLYISTVFDAELYIDTLCREREIALRFADLVKMHYANRKQVCDYAAELYITPNYLNQVVKKITGYTASHHIQQRVIFEAKRRAVTATFKLKEIAYALGFEDCGHFSKFFKRKCGMTYTRYRREAIQTGAFSN